MDETKKTNLVAILGIIFAFLFAPLGLVLSIVGLVQSKKHDGKGKVVSVIGVVISILMIFISLALMVAFVIMARDSSDEQEVKTPVEQSSDYSYSKESKIDIKVAGNKLEVTEIGVVFEVPENVKDLIYVYQNQKDETITFTSESLANAEYKSENQVYNCSIESAPLGKITILRPDDALYNLTDTGVVKLADSRKLVYQTTYFPKCIEKYGKQLDIGINVVRDVMDTAKLSTAKSVQ